MKSVQLTLLSRVKLAISGIAALTTVAFYSDEAAACIPMKPSDAEQVSDVIVTGTFVRVDYTKYVGFGYIIPTDIEKGQKSDRYEISWDNIPDDEGYDTMNDCRPGIPKSGTFARYKLEKSIDNFYSIIGRTQKSVEDK